MIERITVRFIKISNQFSALLEIAGIFRGYSREKLYQKVVIVSFVAHSK